MAVQAMWLWTLTVLSVCTATSYSVDTGKPYFTVKPEEHLEVAVGQTVRIACSVDGIPPPKVKWQSRSNPAKTFTGGQIADYSSTMTIIVSSDYHGAYFQCIAGNQLGLISTSVRLAVVRNDPNNDSTDDCMRQLIGLSGMTDAAKTKAVSSFQENGADQSHFYHDHLYANAKALLEDLQIPGIINRNKLFKCLHKEYQAEAGCGGPCGLHGGICKLVQDSYRCQCPPGFSGMMCEQELNECELKRPCLNGATCTDHVNNFTCTCAPGFYGRRCETDRNECASSPCVEGSCVDVINGFQCECLVGYAGKVCDEEIDECSSNPCNNGGSCRDHIGKFTCDCSPGFAGPTCKTDVDECASSPCQNKATCQDGANSYTCECPLGHDGDHCQNLWLTKTSLQKGQHAAYTRWGRRDCPPNTELIYQGFVGSSRHSYTGSGVDSLCMPEEPQYGRYSDYHWRGLIVGTVYQMQGLNKPYSASFTNRRASCAVCMAVNRTSTIMIPARYECPANWHREYHGYIMSTQWNKLKSMYLCFDDELDDAPALGSAGQQLYPTAAESAFGIPSTYSNARELTCAVCSK